MQRVQLESGKVELRSNSMARFAPDHGRLKSRVTLPSGSRCSRSLANGGLRIYRHNIALPCLSLGATRRAACKLNAPDIRHGKPVRYPGPGAFRSEK